MKTNSDNRPKAIMAIGNGKYHVNTDIREVETEMDGETRVSYECDTVVVEGRPTYPVVVEKLVRERYTVSDELALHRQMYSKTDEYDAYNAYCERCKAMAREVFDAESGGE